MKKSISLMLALILVLGIVPALAYAAEIPSVTLTADKTQIHPGDEIILTLTLDSAIENVMLAEFYVTYDTTLFVRGEATVGTALPGTQVSAKNVALDGTELKYDGSDGAVQKFSVNVFNLDEDAAGVPGTVATIQFTAREDIQAEISANFTLEYLLVEDSAFFGIDVRSEGDVQVTVSLDHSHGYEAVVTDPTCTEGGYTIYTCSCGHSYTADETQALGHSYENGSCTRCGGEDPEKAEVIASGWSGYTQWTLDSDGVLTIYGSGTMKNYGYGGGQPWAEYAAQIRSVVIEDGVTSVGSGAFMNLSGLERVTLPEKGLARIGEAAFYGCAALKEITIPEGVYTIWSYTFKNCFGLSEVNLPRTLIKIDQGAFENCTAISYIFMPGNLEIIGAWSFKGCTALAEADMRWTDATTIREGAFKNCSSLTNVTLPANIQTLGDSCFYGIGATSFTVPDTVTAIESWCFARAYSLTEITFQGDAPAIGEGAFNKLSLTACYPEDNSTWTAEIMQSYGGTVIWKAK